MRVLGYPPGWYQQAKVNTLAIFDGSKEDGELNEGLDNTVQEFNKDSFIEYPGFNCPVPQGIRDVRLNPNLFRILRSFLTIVEYQY